MPKQYTFEELKAIVRSSVHPDERAIALDYAYTMGRRDRLAVIAKELTGFFSHKTNGEAAPEIL